MRVRVVRGACAEARGDIVRSHLFITSRLISVWGESDRVVRCAVRRVAMASIHHHQSPSGTGGPSGNSDGSVSSRRPLEPIVVV